MSAIRAGWQRAAAAALGLVIAAAFGVGGPGLSADAAIPAPLQIGVAPAGAPVVNLVVMGDSYASAAMPFDRGTLNALGAPSVCARGPAWPRLLAPTAFNIKLTHVSCSGATVPDLVDRRMRVGEPVQLQALSIATNLVMLGIGGNDAGFSEVFSACRQSDPALCSDAAQRLAPRSEAVATVASPRLRIADLRDAFAGHRLCDPEPYQWGRDGEIPFHPNAAGHAALAEALSHYLDGLVADGALPLP